MSEEVHVVKARMTLEAGDGATNPSVIGYRLPWGIPPKNRRGAASSFCQHAGTYHQISTMHTFGTGLGLVGSNRYEAIKV
jgi:hypothetical protein